MTDHIRRELRPGEELPALLNVSEELGPGALLFCPSGPDWVIAPRELGGAKLYIRQRAIKPCPRCQAASRFWGLDGGLGVYSCEPCGQFYWVRLER